MFVYNTAYWKFYLGQMEINYFRAAWRKINYLNKDKQRESDPDMFIIFPIIYNYLFRKLEHVYKSLSYKQQK